MVSAIKTLADVRKGETVQVVSLRVQGALRCRLPDVGLISGALVTCVHSGNGIAAYRIRGAVIALRDTDAADITVL
ncbi:MAG: ferrous iron transport protein A [Oscillospiraceae bacterium]|nr:ferrous iron transport protein A [Oscillospiraceae bacterium]